MNELLQVIMDACGCNSCKQGKPCKKVQAVWNKLQSPSPAAYHNDEQIKKGQDAYKNN